jgi:hypothetical protein
LKSHGGYHFEHIQYHFFQEGVPILGQLDVTSSTHKPVHHKSKTIIYTSASIREAIILYTSTAEEIDSNYLISSSDFSNQPKPKVLLKAYRPGMVPSKL